MQSSIFRLFFPLAVLCPLTVNPVVAGEFVAVEGELVVHAVPVLVAQGQDLIALTVGILDDDVEHRHPP